MKISAWLRRFATVGAWLISAQSGVAQTAPATPPALSAPAAATPGPPPVLKDAARPHPPPGAGRTPRQHKESARAVVRRR